MSPSCQCLTKLLYVACISAEEHGGGREACKQDAASRLASSLAACQHIQQGGLAAPGRSHLHMCVKVCYQGASPSNRLASSLAANHHIQQSGCAAPRRPIGKGIRSICLRLFHDIKDSIMNYEMGQSGASTLKHAQLDGSQDILR